MKRATVFLAGALLATGTAVVMVEGAQQQQEGQQQGQQASPQDGQPRDTPSTSPGDTASTVPSDSAATTSPATRPRGTTRIYTPGPVDPK